MWRLSWAVVTGALACAPLRCPLPGRPAVEKQAYPFPLTFEANRGQAPPQTKFLARVRGYSLHLEAAALAMVPHRGRSVRIEFLGASGDVAVEGLDPRPGRIHYLLGTPCGRHIPNVPHYGRIRYRQLQQGVDLIVRGAAGFVEFDWVVAAGVRADGLRFRVEGAEEVRLDAAGDLVIRTGTGQFTLRRPLAYQDRGDRRISVTSEYFLHGRSEVGIRVASYDSQMGLVIDPVLSYATLLGSASDEVAYAVTTDAAGRAYVAGYTASLAFPASAGAYQLSYAGGARDAFVARLDPWGSTFEYVTYLGGSGDDVAYGLAVDGLGNAYVAGGTSSADFPTTAGALRRNFAGGAADAFVAVLNSSGSGLLYSTYLGGAGEDVAYALALTAAGEATVAGETGSANFPVTGGAWRTTYGGGLSDAFVSRLNPAGTALVFSTFLGGSVDDVGYGIAVDSLGNSYAAGYTQSGSFPTTAGSLQPAKNASYDGFVTALNPSGTAALYSTFLGGADADFGLGVAVDGTGAAYVTGYTASSDFPRTVGVLQPSKGNGYDAFVAKLAPAGNTLAYATFLGANGDDYGLAIAVDAAGNAYVTGDTASSNFPVTADAFQSALGGLFNAFLAKIHPAASSLLFSSLFGGYGYETGYAVSLDSAGRSYLAGSTVSPDFPTTAGGAQRDFAGAAEAFLLRTVALNRTPAPGTPSPAAGSGVTQTFTFTFSHPQGWQNLNVVNVLINDFLDGRRACYLAYVRPLNVLYLVNDAGDGLLPALVLNGTGSVSNGQCTVYGPGSSAAGSGTTLTLTLNIAFSSLFAGNRILYLAARDTADNNSGWVPGGVWNVPGLPPSSPAVGAVTPASGAGRAQAFTFTFTDASGWQNLGVVNILINDYLDGRHACYLAYSRPLGVLYLVNDPGNALLPELYLGTATSVSNSQCTVYGVGSSAVGSGTTLTLTLNIAFGASFVGDRIVYMAARDVAGGNSGWQAKGSWRVP